MGEKKGFFSSIFGGNSTSFSEEEQQQRDYALTKEKEDLIDPVSSKSNEQPSEPSVPEDVVKFILQTLDEILYLSSLNGTTTVIKNTPNGLWLDIENSDDVGRLIGREGQTLAAFQTILRSIVYKKYKEPYRIFVDAGDYHQRRFKRARGIALRAVKDVMRNQTSIELEPMTADERRHVHLLLEREEGIRTFSEGDGADRRIVVALNDQ